MKDGCTRVEAPLYRWLGSESDIFPRWFTRAAVGVAGSVAGVAGPVEGVGGPARIMRKRVRDLSES